MRTKTRTVAVRRCINPSAEESGSTIPVHNAGSKLEWHLPEIDAVKLSLLHSP